MKQETASCFGKTVLVALALTLIAGVAWAQFAGDGLRQNDQGGWDVPYDFCSLDSEVSGNLDPASCEAANGDWDDEDGCYYNRPECYKRILCGTPISAGAPAIPDVNGFCVAPDGSSCPHDWRTGVGSSGACTDGESRSQSSCETAGYFWYGPACRGKFTWDPALVPVAGGQYQDCARCHNVRHYPKPDEVNHYHGGERSVSETYSMTGHKNMLRPDAPVGYTDPSTPLAPRYTPGYPWAGANGVPYATDSSGNPINWLTGEITVGGTAQDLLWIYDGWIAETPRSYHAGTASYACARCHATGYEAAAADETLKQPYLMFGDTDPGGTVTGSWDQYGILCSRCHGSNGATIAHHPNIAGKEATGGTATGATRVNLCMDCHRQESSDLPMDPNAPGINLKVGPYHNTVEFLSHNTGNLFLNSPHGRFGGTFAQIGDKTQYDTHFKNEGETYPFSGNQGGCTQCHDVHKSTVPDANPAGDAIHEECTACHTKNLDLMLHPATRGTPLEHKDTAPNEACISCHMEGGTHLFRVNVDPAYSTFPLAAMTGTANANTADDDGFPAVWADLDFACGKCHGGGTQYVLTAGDITTGTKLLTVDSAIGIAAGQRIEIAGAGAGGAVHHTYVASVAGNVVTLAGNASTTVTDAEVVQNPTKNGAGYMSKAGLAGYARAIHNDAPVVNFTYQLGNPNTLEVTFSSALSTCSGDNALCDAFAWDFGDGTTSTEENPVHLYTTGGTKIVTLTVTQYSVGSGTKTKKIKVYAADLPPVIASTCTWDANTWTMNITDASTDDNGIVQEKVTWGDGSLTSVLTSPPWVFNHTYLGPGFFTVTHTVTDTVGQTAQNVCLANPAYFTIGGTTYQAGGVLPLSGVKLVFVRGATVAKTVYSNALGVYSATNLKPGAYTIYPSKIGYSFPTYNLTIGPSNTNYNPTANP